MTPKQEKALFHVADCFVKHLGHTMSGDFIETGVLTKVFLDHQEKTIKLAIKPAGARFPQFVYTDQFGLKCSCGEGQ